MDELITRRLARTSARTLLKTYASLTHQIAHFGATPNGLQARAERDLVEAELLRRLEKR
jgi:hypothetical protein